ncbi:FHA domain-containing protein [Actinomycetospora termitidis]|uniref:FHA domain-containing protein n=1 Tax=Actinomycetospora termitidis TaxID=3053470 RepID=A0ABT7MEE6_9PSEU|nr:FHA domain-containing protein [Actinomycetospora sp. Odt1-22]MDL5158831.1 FHA domain-containing protein [Actinomycetospora sp. Odt1-22]
MSPAVCRNGHASETDDFCDECGAPITPDGAPVPASTPAPPAPAPAATAAVGEGTAEVCPRCGTPRTGRFCEEDGHDFVLQGGSAATPAPAPSPAPPAAPPAVGNGPEPEGTWLVTVEADRRYYESVVAREGPDIAAVTFPNYYPSAEVPLLGAEVRIGRRRVNGSTPPPQIDLAGPPLDPGVSHLHAVLLPVADDRGGDGWSVLDPGSTNGTTINYSDDPIALDTVVPLRAGDRVHVGAFTTLVIERR